MQRDTDVMIVTYTGTCMHIDTVETLYCLCLPAGSNEWYLHSSLDKRVVPLARLIVAKWMGIYHKAKAVCEKWGMSLSRSSYFRSFSLTLCVFCIHFCFLGVVSQPLPAADGNAFLLSQLCTPPLRLHHPGICSLIQALNSLVLCCCQAPCIFEDRFVHVHMCIWECVCVRLGYLPLAYLAICIVWAYSDWIVLDLLIAGSEMLQLLIHVDGHSTKGKKGGGGGRGGGSGKGQSIVMDQGSKIVCAMMEMQSKQTGAWKLRKQFCLAWGLEEICVLDTSESSTNLLYGLILGLDLF